MREPDLTIGLLLEKMKQFKAKPRSDGYYYVKCSPRVAAEGLAAGVFEIVGDKLRISEEHPRPCVNALKHS